MKYLVLFAVLLMVSRTGLRAEDVSSGDESNPYKKHWSKQYNVIVPEGQASDDPPYNKRCFTERTMLSYVTEADQYWNWSLVWTGDYNYARNERCEFKEGDDPLRLDNFVCLMNKDYDRIQWLGKATS
jgi:hypothetical protein